MPKQLDPKQLGSPPQSEGSAHFLSKSVERFHLTRMGTKLLFNFAERSDIAIDGRSPDDFSFIVPDGDTDAETYNRRPSFRIRSVS